MEEEQQLAELIQLEQEQRARLEAAREQVRKTMVSTQMCVSIQFGGSLTRRSLGLVFLARGTFEKEHLVTLVNDSLVVVG